MFDGRNIFENPEKDASLTGNRRNADELSIFCIRNMIFGADKNFIHALNFLTWKTKKFFENLNF